MSGVDQIHHGDALDVLPTLARESVDLVFADPPYYLQLRSELWRPNMTRVDAVNEAWDRFDDFAAYDDFTRAWLRAVRRVMKPTATIWISGTYHNIFRVGAIMQDLGFWVLNTIAWYKPNATPNFHGTRLKNDVEFVIWAKRDKTGRYTFNHHEMKEFNDGKQLGSVWAIPTCIGRERLRDADGEKLHPTQKPEELLKRIILASSNPGDVVLDPFVGTGTSVAVARWLHRHWIGIDSEAVYVEAARARVTAIQPLDPGDPLLLPSARSRARRVPFSVLLERGYLQVGQTLYLKHSDAQAEILENGYLKSGERIGTIHRLGAQLKGVPSCNGWTQWYYDDEETGQRKPLDVLRKRVRQVLENEER